MTTPPNDVSDAMSELGELISSGRMRVLPALPGMNVYISPWPDGSVDTLVVKHEDSAHAERTNPDGHPVWRFPAEPMSKRPEGAPLADCLTALRELPGPLARNAPREPIANIDTDRHM